MSEKYGIASLDEARAYFAHPVLGPRLVECARLVNQVEGLTLREILGSPDDLKFRSSMTLFQRAAPECGEFGRALQKSGDWDGAIGLYRRVSEMGYPPGMTALGSPGPRRPSW